MSVDQKDNTLNAYDLDGTLSQLGVKEALEQQPGSSMEIQKYFMAAVDYVRAAVPELKELDVYDGIKAKALGVVLPDNGNRKYWAKFPTEQNNSIAICPAVDHFLVVAAAVTLYFEEIAVQEGESLLGQKVKTVLENPRFTDNMFLAANKVGMDFAEMDEQGVEIIDRALSRNALAVIMSNSSNTKAEAMMKKAGFGDKMVDGRAERGKIGIVGSSTKWKVDGDWHPEGTRWGDELDMSDYHGLGAKLNLQRRVFHKRLAELMRDAGADKLIFASDIIELDGPAQNWPEFNPSFVLRTNSNSVPASTKAAQELFGARAGENLVQMLREME